MNRCLGWTILLSTVRRSFRAFALFNSCHQTKILLWASLGWNLWNWQIGGEILSCPVVLTYNWVWLCRRQNGKHDCGQKGAPKTRKYEHIDSGRQPNVVFSNPWGFDRVAAGLVVGSFSCLSTQSIFSPNSSTSHWFSASVSRQTKEVFLQGKQVEAQQLGVSVALIGDDRRDAALLAAHSWRSHTPRTEHFCFICDNAKLDLISN